MQEELSVETKRLGKRFGDRWALRDVNIEVPTGSVLGLLGHNGAGKTTAIRILTTLAKASEGSARVAGLDVVGCPEEVRQRIGLAGQYATVDELMTGRANLEMVGRLYRLGRKQCRRRATELLERLRLADVGDQLVKTYSGGMRRRLDLGASLIATPPVLFLDEPTTGLDPESRNDLWELLRDLVRDGTTLILTTQYLDEADHLANQIVVLDQGSVIAEGTPGQLKRQIGGERVEVTVASGHQLDAAALAVKPFADGEMSLDQKASLLTAPVPNGTRLIDVVRELDKFEIDASDVHLREATLDDVFLSITGLGNRPDLTQSKNRHKEEVPA